MSAVYIGAYTWSFSEDQDHSSYSSALSNCSTTDVSGLVVSISSSKLLNSSAVSGHYSEQGSNVSALRLAPPASYCRCACETA